MIDQSVQGIHISPDYTLYSLLPVRNDLASPCSSVLNFCCDSTSTLNALRLHEEKVELISSFANNGIVIPLPPFREKVFEAEEVQWLTSFFNQIYPSKYISHLPRYYQLCGRVTLCGDLVGSVLPGGNNFASSVIMAFWPSTGDNVLSIDYSRMKVGVVQYFVKHSVYFLSEQNIDKVEHVFAYVKWRTMHPNYDHFGRSATVCANMFEPPGVCSFLPVQRIACRAAHAVMRGFRTF